jgi:acyl transferase domain-containing protein/thioesterase domain-containing protein/acyl carrier protein
MVDEHSTPAGGSGTADSDVAVVGMSGRFPGAPDVDTLWTRVLAGDDCLTDLDPRSVIADGVDETVVRDPDYVLRTGVIEAVEMFDHEFFGIGRRDASVMDPQHRHFLECSWEALEAAGHTPEGFPGAIGVFGGSGMNTYLLHNLLTNPALVEQLGWFLIRHTGNDKDFLTTSVSYRLGLEGPSVNVQTACSTSLVAVHLAVQSLLTFECDLALAGGVTIEFPHGRGYHYREGEILSPDGHCRAFDAASDGTVLTGGVGVVALRRLTDAIEDGDPILAVIKGTAINNDGNRKVGFLAPSVDGHADVVKEALAVSGVGARTISMLEAHGTGTAVGDPIEVAALTEAFRSSTDDIGFCRLVSTKPNIGHLDTAAGAASLIKVVQALRHRTLPPLANHTAPSPLVDIEQTPFTLSGSAEPWNAIGPRRAGVSSLGVGGTNAHVIVEEAPTLRSTPPAEPSQLLVISGANRTAVDAASDRLAAFIEATPDINIADVAHTLMVGRRPMRHRRVVAVTDARTAPLQLRLDDRRRRVTAEVPPEPPRILFAFPGGGSQYPGMGAGLDHRFAEFHRVRRDGVEIARRLDGPDLDPLFETDGDVEQLRRPTASLPAVFLTSLALARQWMAWGIQPDVMVGHSLGEYVAAHLAGVMSLEDALRLVIARSELMERASAGGAAMLVIPLPESDVVDRLPARVSLAAVNTDDECVAAGPAAAISELVDRLAAEGLDSTHIPLAAAAHSSMLDTVLDEYEAIVATVELHPPERPYVSNVTGGWITPEQACNPRYWVDHLRGTVRFAAGLRTAVGDRTTLVIELGPGQSLASSARRSGLPVRAVSTLRHPDDHVSDTEHSLAAFGQMWVHGVDVDLDRTTGDGRRRLTLPTYPFQRERCWITPGEGSAIAARTVESSAPAEMRRLDDVADMGRLPAWTAAPPCESAPVARHWMLVGGDRCDSIARELIERGRNVTRLEQFDRTTADLSAVPADDDVGVLVLGAGGTFDDAETMWLDQAAEAIRWLGSRAASGRFVALTSDALPTNGSATNPVDALAAGPVLVAPREYPGLETALIDVTVTAEDGPHAAALIVDEIELATGIVALHDGQRLRPSIDPVPALSPGEHALVRHGGTYLVTGALGGVGGVLAAHLARRYAANLVVVTTDELPGSTDRERFLRTHAFDHPTSRRIRQLMALEQLGGKVSVHTADVTDAAQIRRVLDDAERLVGRIDGAVHAAGRLRDGLIAMTTAADQRHVTEPKAGAALVLAQELGRRGAESLVLVSSTSTSLAPEGQMSYVAANSVLEALAGRRGTLRVVTIGFGMWAGTGMASDAARRIRLDLPLGEPVVHPVFAELAHDRRGAAVLSGTFDARYHSVLDHHRTADGLAVLPGTAHLALMIDASRLAGVETAPSLQDIALVEPLAVPDDVSVTVRVVIEADGEAGRRAIRIDSDAGSGTGWVTHSEGFVVAAPSIDTTGTTVDLAAIGDRCQLDGGHPTSTTSEHLTLGPSWQLDAEVRLGDGEAFGYIDASSVDEDEGWAFNPAVVDVATGVGIALARVVDEDRLHVPMGYEAVRLHARVATPCDVHAVRRPESTDELLVVDLNIVAPDGSVLMSIGGLRLRPIASSSTLSVSVPLEQATSSGAGLLGVLEPLGLRPEEATEWFDRLVMADQDRLVVTSVDLDALTRHGEVPQALESTATAEDRTDQGLEALLVEMWRELLGVDDVQLDDDFFELGGHSLMAIRLMTRVKRDLGVRLELSAMFDASTITALAGLLRAKHPDIDSALGPTSHAAARTPSTGSPEPDAPRRQLVTISGQGDRRPLYVVHGAGGNVLFLSTLARALARERPIHGFQALGVNDGEVPDGSVEAMAARYIAELRAHSEGPYLLGGYSGGGIVALEMARQLKGMGESVDHVVLFDSSPPGTTSPGRRVRWAQLTRRLVRGQFSVVWGVALRSFKGSVHRVVPERSHRRRDRELQERALGYDGDLTDFVNLYHYFSATADQYVLASYDVDVTVLKCDEVWPVIRDDYFWSGYVTGRLAWHIVPGDHHSMFYPENAVRLAAVLRRVLDPLDDVSAGDET